MSLTLHFHPLSSFCWKALIALYENDTPFTPNLVNLGDAAERAALLKLWRNRQVSGAARRCARRDRPGVEHHHRISRSPLSAAATRFIPDDAERALQTRLRDRFYDLYVHLPMQKIVGDRLRPQEARIRMASRRRGRSCGPSYAMIEQQMAAGDWAMGGDFGLADCAAAPALFYGNKVEPFGEAHKNLRAYLERLKARPSSRGC